PKPTAIRPRAASPAPNPGPPSEVRAPSIPTTTTPKPRGLAPVLPLNVPGERPSAPSTPKAHSSDVKRAARAKKKRASDGRFVLDAKRFKYLSEVGINWCLKAALGEVDVVERPNEVEYVLDVLAKKDANNPCLVGP